MTHNDIKTKFMIEYDKANVTSSYPSLTEYEIATILDKAYNALISLKFTGNNPRGVAFEGDVKSLQDLQPLITKIQALFSVQPDTGLPENVYRTELPLDIMYFVSAYTRIDIVNSVKWMYENPEDVKSKDVQPMGGNYERDHNFRVVPIKLVTHLMAELFFYSTNNIPWVDNPVGYIENNKFYVAFDPIAGQTSLLCWFTYIKEPARFVNDSAETEFELSDTMADELVTLAVTFALENVESPRLNTQSQMKGLES